MNKLFQLHLDNIARERVPVNFGNKESHNSVFIYDVISADWGVGAMAVAEQINQADPTQDLNLYINSPGGDVFESRAIMAAIDRFPGKTVAFIDSLCASAATSIALACDEVNMNQGALFMIHNASGMVWGDKQAMRDTADLLQKVELSIIKDYTTKTGMDDAAVIAMMDAETWMTADEALANGFVDSVIEAKSGAKNTWNLSAYGKPPPDPQPEEITEEPAQPAGFFMSQANANRLRILEI